MNKWIIFIIIIGVAAIAGVLFNIVNNGIYTQKIDITIDDEMMQKEPDPVVRFVNTSEYSISRGVVVLHNNTFSMNLLGTQAPKAYESLAEVGDPSAVISLVKNNPGVNAALEIPAIGPKATEDIIIPRSMIDGKGTRVGANNIGISYMAMIVETNDGVVWLNDSPFYKTKNSNIQQDSVLTEVLDMGTEKNEPIGSGFAGGQPDPARGAENINNGTPTTEPVRHHPQFYEDDAISNEIVRIDMNI